MLRVEFWLFAATMQLVQRIVAQGGIQTEITLPTVSPQASTSCTQATWLAWSEWSQCSDECGSCGVQMRTRTCLSTDSNCVCGGESTQMQYCNLSICRYPRATCCYNLVVTSLNGDFACLKTSTLPG